ncbi:hypothetical protein JRQ81_000005 [Phrynocephalus forsythii]|uniref:Ig-like domain-containing protein n=1 Tax=Phrynocephalus forsythii TaxID=171643 RepID=A0A9Q0X5B9_9SAUR|nr:hypothetical protein JRQ81_000005 [Phrynocephalus forsythii]
MKRPFAPAARGSAPRLALWALLLALPLARGLEVGDAFVQLDFFQESFPSGKEAGEEAFEFNAEEIFHVDWGQKRDVWRLEDFQDFVRGDVQGALGNLAILKTNLEILMKRSGRKMEPNKAPSATVYPRKPVELGDPNVLICFVDGFFPPVLNITWLKNGQVVSKGVQETGFLPSQDWTFRQFSYLTFVPEEGDLYACRVDHWGLRESLTKPLDIKKPTPISETPEDVVCGLGLVFGIFGIVAGSILFSKAWKMNEPTNHRRGAI